MKFIFGIIGGYIGALVDSFSGFCFGAAIGFLFGYILELNKHVRVLEEKIALIQSNLIDSNVMIDETTSSGIQVDNVEIEEISLSDEDVDSKEVTQINQATKVPDAVPSPETIPQSSAWEEVNAGGQAPYILAYGNANTTGRSHSSSKLMNIINQDTNGEMVGKVEAGQEIILKGDTALIKHKKIPWQRILLWAVLIMGVIVIATMVFRIIHKMGNY